MFSKKALLCFLLLLTSHANQNNVLAAKILALLIMPSPSHHIWNRSLMLALAAKGHQVTVVSPDPEKEPVPNHKDIVIEGLYEYLHASYDYESLIYASVWEMVGILFQWGRDVCNFSLATNGTKQLMELSTKEKFDLIIVEAIFSDCFLAYVPVFGNPPVMAITGFGDAPWVNSIVGNPYNPSYMPSYMTLHASNMNFGQRMENFLYNTFSLLYRHFIHMPRQDILVRQYLGESVPPLSEIGKNISLILLNTHFSFNDPHPLVPAKIEVGGMHVKPAKSLPKDIQTFLDDAKDGAIFFSLGSNLRSDKMTPEKCKAILDAFAELPHRILWKWESDSLPGQPKNVKVGKWLPQNDILGHPNVKLFITHSGLLSTQEAIYHGVPIVGIPFMVDQFTNIQKSINRGVGEMVDYKTMTKESFLSTIRKVLYTPSYAKNMKKLSELFRDRPETPLETAVYWTEYVIKHGGAKHLRSSALELELYQYLLLDVITVLVTGTMIGLFILYIIAKKIYSVIVRSSESVKVKKY